MDFFTPTPITTLLFFRSVLTSAEKSESPLMSTKRMVFIVLWKIVHYSAAYCILRKLSGGRSHATRDTLAPSVHVNVGNPVAIDLPAALADGVGFPAPFRISCTLQA